MPRRLKLIIAYDGAPFGGWQAQKDGNTIQDFVERAFARIEGSEVRVHGAGRTDAGVHALAQCAHADVRDRRLAAERWVSALNAALPPTIRVLRCRYVSDAFHARYSARGKIYRYQLWNAPVLPPFEYRRSWHIPAVLDIAAMSAAARDLEGEHDFAGFAANRGTPANDTVRTVHSVRIRHSGPKISIEFDGDGFLYKMVRLMVGMLVRIGRGAAERDEIRRALSAQTGGWQALNRTAAPADGLVLVRVRY